MIICVIYSKYFIQWKLAFRWHYSTHTFFPWDFYHTKCVGLVFVNLTQRRAIWDEEIWLGRCLFYIPCRKIGESIFVRLPVAETVGAFSWLIFERAQPTIGRETSVQVVLGCVRKYWKQAMESKQADNTPEWLLLRFLSPGPYAVFLLWLLIRLYCKLCDKVSPAFPTLLLVVVFIMAIESKLGHWVSSFSTGCSGTA